MIKSLTIQNYALIASLNIDFENGLTIITGETGAGKSILIGALSLILGQRAEKNVLRDAEQKCVIEAVFNIKGYELEQFFSQNSIDYDDITIIRREILPNGKSRAFINDTPFDLSTLKSLGVKLVDIHSQHQNLELTDNRFQLEAVDVISENIENLKEYKIKFKEYSSLLEQEKEISESIAKSKQDQEYYQFQHDILSKTNLVEGELEKLESELNELEHAEEIKTALTQSSLLLYGEEMSAITKLKEVTELLQKIKEHYKPSENLYERIESSYIELKDAWNEIDGLCEKMEFDPERFEVVKSRLDTIYSLQQKFRVTSVPELIRLKEEFASNLALITHADEKIDAIRKQISACEASLSTLAKKLREKRSQRIPDIEKNVSTMLQQLGMPNATFKIRHELLETYTPSGMDVIRFLFSANKKEAEFDIARIASGGEISRFMLALKYFISSKKNLPAIVFDEIDTGVSGDIADKMGNIINNLASNMQVINITHLPQIASKGKNHFLVYKKDENNTTNTFIKKLTSHDRVMEIAKMLSGEQVTEAAINNAKELLNSNS